MTTETAKLTPLMEQYWSIKNDYKDSLVLFQVGDFYELFFEDAQKAAAFLGIALTKRGTHKGEPIPLCGVPLHTVDHYLQKLVKGGFCVVLCDQLEEAQPGKMVKRGVSTVLTPATLTDTKLLDPQSASYIFSFFECDNQWGLVFGELMMAQLYVTLVPAGSEKRLETELSRFFPQEVIVSENDTWAASYFKKQGYFTSHVSSEEGFDSWARERFSEKQNEQLNDKSAIKKSLEVLHSYLKKTNQAILNTLQTIYFYETQDFVEIDSQTQKHLEIVLNQQGSRENSLLAALDRCKTAMGSRLLKKWLVRPLVQKDMINHRLSVVEYLVQNQQLCFTLDALFKSMSDGERIVGRIVLDRAGVNDYIQLKEILKKLPQLKRTIEQSSNAFLSMIENSINPLPLVTELLESSLDNELGCSFFIKTGYDVSLDEIKKLVFHSQEKLLALEQEEQVKNGVSSLKIRYNNVQGYYVEVTKVNIDSVPDYYVRRQTLANRERYTFPALQQLEHSITHAEQDAKVREKELFEDIKRKIVPYFASLRKTMHALAQLDVLHSFAIVAYEQRYVKPSFNDDRTFAVHGALHPVLEQKYGTAFIPNDIALNDGASVMVITGPNMGGKSTYLRTTALMSIMAQCGSFVPAKFADLPIVDKIFTRIGASDNIAQGKSTFLIEMEETAHLCRYATERSLVILDEVGRGTSTFDGLAIAQAVIEYLHEKVKARTLFATHYHELTFLADTHKGIVNYHATSTTDDRGIVFLHKIKPGKAGSSCGIAIAHYANLPDSIIKRAYELERSFKKFSDIL